MSLYHDHDDLDALDFFVAEEVCEDGAESDALDGFATDDPTHPVPDIDAMDQFMPGEVEDEDTEPDTAPLQIEEPHGAAETAGAEEGVDSNGAPLFTVVNPPGTVSVWALMDGRIHRVTLSAKVTSMSEAELAEEVLVIAALARQNGLAAQHSYMLGSYSEWEPVAEMGTDEREVLRDFMENTMGLMSEEQATAKRAEVFSTRYR